MPTNTQLLQLAARCAANAADAKYIPLIENLNKRIEALETKVAELSATLPAKRSPKDETLYNALRAKRMEAANELEIPAYCVATNKMLNAIVATKPKTLDELRSIYGFGPNKVKLYGEMFLKVVADWS
jgi:ATP-dependent DNA helicase RecQ